MTSRLFVILISLAVFVAGGWAGRFLRDEPHPEMAKPAVDEAPVSESRPDSSESLRARIEATPRAGLAALYEELADRRWPDLDSLLAYRTLLERCLREDPERLMTAFNLFLFERRTRDLVQVWLEVDAEGLFARVFKDGDPVFKNLRREVAFAAPREFLDAATRQKDRPTESDSEIGSAILRVSESDPREAITWLERFALREDTQASGLVIGTPVTETTNSNHAEVAAHFASVDPEAALAWAQARTTPMGKKSVTTAVLASWALADSDAAARAFSGLGEDSGISLESVAWRIAVANPELAFRWAETNQTRASNAYSIESLSRQVKDPLSLRRMESQIHDSELRDRFLHMHLSTWGDRPFDEGFDWALSVPSESRSTALRALAEGLEKIPYDEAVRLSERIDDETLRESFLQGLRENLRETDPVRLIELARASGDENELNATIEYTAYTHAILSLIPPREVYEWTQQSDVGGFRQDLYEELAQRYYRENPSESKEWIESLESGYEKENLLRGLAAEMSRQNPESALAWASGYSETQHRDEVISSVAWHVSERRPEEAFHLALSVPNTHREGLLGTLTRSVRTWAKRDPAAARAAVANAPQLTDRERQSLATWIYAP